MAECTHPAQIMGKGGKMICLSCGAEVKPEKPAKKPAKDEKEEKDAE